jgi:hypothetical protein
MKNLCNCSEPEIFYNVCKKCLRFFSWETWLKYWEKKIKKEKNDRY